MDESVRLALAFGLALLLSLIGTPIARRLALKTDFLDHPRDYKQHLRSTPYLGGTAVMASWAVSAIVLGGAFRDYWPILLGAFVNWAVGTVDDRRGLSVRLRFFLQLGAALLLWFTDLGWHLTGSYVLDLGLTVLWTVGLTNAANLMDNQDGAAGSSALVASAGIGVVAAAQGEPALGALAMALAGACGGFLPSNLASPSKIFMGDGGSAPIGFILAASVMSIPAPDYGWLMILGAIPLVGVFVFDTTLVVISRLRAGRPVLSGGRDHYSHRLLSWFHTPVRVAWVLGATQVVATLLGAALYDSGELTLQVAALVYLLCAGLLICVLELPLGSSEGGGRATPDEV